MTTNTLILSTKKVTMPKTVTIDFVINLIDCSIMLVEYFGIEIDNPPDYLDEEMLSLKEEITHLEFYFETEVDINYTSISDEEIGVLVKTLLMNSKKPILYAEENDLTVYL